MQYIALRISLACTNARYGTTIYTYVGCIQNVETFKNLIVGVGRLALIAITLFTVLCEAMKNV